MTRAMLVACLLVGAPALAAGVENPFGPPADNPNAEPSSYIRLELLASGVDFPSVFTTRILKLSWCTGRVRGGITAFEDYLSWNDNPGLNSYCALNADYILFSHQRKTLPFYSTTYEGYVQAAGSFVGIPFVRLNGGVGAAFYGVGVGLEVGAIYLPPVQLEGGVYPYAAAYVRLLTFDFPTGW